MSGATLRPAQSINDQHLALASCHPVKGNPQPARYTSNIQFLIAFVVTLDKNFDVDSRHEDLRPRKLYFFSGTLTFKGDERRAGLTTKLPRRDLRFHRV